MPRHFRKSPVVVVGLDCMTGLQTARVLHRREVPVIGVAKNPGHPCCHTRCCVRTVPADTASDELVDVLLELQAECGQQLVLIPCTDLSVLTISRNRAALSGKYHLRLPEAEMVELLVDKAAFYSFARDAGFPVAGTFLLEKESDLEAAISGLRFPCILKPHLKTPQWETRTKEKAFKVFAPEELRSIYSRCASWADRFVVQEWIDGDDSELFTCNCYFSAHSEPLVTFVSRKIRQWHPETGTACIAEEYRNDAVLNSTIDFFKKTGLRGFGYLEMKHDKRDGRYYIIEPNIGRPTGRSAMAERAGVEFLYTAYCDMLSWPPPPNRHQQYRGVKWIHIRRDLLSVVYNWRRGRLTASSLWRSWRGPKAHAIFSWTDPLPFVLDLFRIR